MAIPMDSSSSLPSLASLPPNAFTQLVSTEKEHTRHWLRGEMISLVDPLIESLFDKIASRFASCSKTTEDSLKTSSDAVGGGNNDGNDDGQHQETMMMMATHHHQITQHHLESPIVQLNVNTFYSSEGAFKLNQHLSHILTNSQNISFTNELTADVVPFKPIKQDDIEPISESNEQIPESQGQGHNWNVADDHDVDEEEEECECDNCMNGGIDCIKLEDDDDGILIDSDDDHDNDESSSSHHLVTKKPRITESESQLQNANKPKCTRQQQTTDQPNQIGEQIATLKLKCHLDHCPQLFTGKNELNSHMLRIHSIRQCRCLVKDCKQSFDNQSNLSRHIKKFHNQFTCHKCVKHFTTYLSVHNNLYHNLGLYGCSYPSCSFTGEFKQKVYGHYKTNHKAEVFCNQQDCDYRTTNRAKLKEHRRTHLGIKPYRCRWEHCDYANVRRYLTLNHIRTQHLVHHHHGSRDPLDFLEVVRDLLL